MNTTYRATTEPSFSGIPPYKVTYWDGNRNRPLSLFHRIRRSSSNFAWGYGGSGPAQLAIAILAKSCGLSDQDREVVMQFKDEVIAKLDINDKWTLSITDIKDWVVEHSPTAES